MNNDSRTAPGQTEDVIDRYSSMIYRIAYSYTGNRYDAEDVMQDVLCRYIEKGIKFESEAHEKAWLIKVTVNRSKSLLSSSARKRSAPIEDADSVTDESQALEAIESPVLNAVMKLDPAQRLCVHLFYYEDMSISQIAEKTGYLIPTVKSHLFRARRALGKMLEREI